MTVVPDMEYGDWDDHQGATPIAVEDGMHQLGAQGSGRTVRRPAVALSAILLTTVLTAGGAFWLMDQPAGAAQDETREGARIHLRLPEPPPAVAAGEAPGQAQLWARLARLEAELYNRPTVELPDAEAAPHVAAEQALLEERRAAFTRGQAALARERAEVAREVGELRSERERLLAAVKDAARQAKTMETLVTVGVVPPEMARPAAGNAQTLQAVLRKQGTRIADLEARAANLRAQERRRLRERSRELAEALIQTRAQLADVNGDLPAGRLRAASVNTMGL